jgi:AbrB family looped-hinge helix DNA binding protein
MSNLATTRLSSKGQVVIPGIIRRRLGLQAGDQFVVLGEGDTVILKAIVPPDREALLGVLKRARTEARRAGVTRRDVQNTIKAVRRRR